MKVYNPDARTHERTRVVALGLERFLPEVLLPLVPALNVCILGTRIAVDVFAALDLKAAATPVHGNIFNHEFSQEAERLGYEKALDEYKRKARASDTVVEPQGRSIGGDHTGRTDGDKWNGHVLATCGSWVMDPTFDQTMEPRVRIYDTRPFALEDPDRKLLNGEPFTFTQNGYLVALTHSGHYSFQASHDWRQTGSASLVPNIVGMIEGWEE